MVSVKLFEGNPNKKVATFEVNNDFLGHFSKLVVTKLGDLRQYCPVADALFRGDVTRVDLAARDGKTYITLSRKLNEWEEGEKKAATAAIHDFFSKSTQPVLIEALRKNITAQPPFNPINSIQKLVRGAFNDQVNPLLASDGGAMELMNVTIKKDGEISAEVALVGSCNGCSSAEDQTLTEATKKIRMVVNAAKKQNPNNEAVQKLNFTGIKILQIPELAIGRG